MLQTSDVSDVVSL